MADIFDMVDTWNAGATTFTAIKMNVTDTASAAGSALMDLQLAGTTVLRLQKNGLLQFGGTTSSFPALRASGPNLEVRRADNGDLGNLVAMGAYLGSGGVLALGNDTVLVRDAADALAQRRTTNPQAFRVYNTFTDTSNYERGVASWSANVIEFGAENAGTGASRNVRIKSNVASVFIATSNTDRWNFNSNGHFLAVADNTYDIGASGAFRPRNIFVGNTLTTGAIVTSMASGILFTGGGYIVTPSNGVMKITNNSDTGFNRLQFGGTTASFPSISRNAANIDFRLADDSALTGIGAASVSVAASTTARPHFALTAGVAPTSPANGDIWFDGTDMKIRIGGVTKTFTII